VLYFKETGRGDIECIHLTQISLVAGFCKHGNEVRATINSGEFVVEFRLHWVTEGTGSRLCCDGTGTESRRTPLIS